VRKQIAYGIPTLFVFNELDLVTSSSSTKEVFDNDHVLRPIPSHPIPSGRFDDFKLDFPWKPWSFYQRLRFYSEENQLS